MEKYCRIGVDVGGTFTDFVLANRRTGTLTHHKEPSGTEDPSLAVAQGMSVLLRRAGERPDSVEMVVHGTTLALNAVIQRRGARVALVISRGFGDTMTLGRGGLPNAYNYKHPKQTPLVPRDMVFEVSARVRPDGSVVARPAEGEVEALAERLRAEGAEAVVVVVVNSYAHPELEAEVADELVRRLPGVLVTQSAALWPEIREFERTLVAVLNGFLHPLMNEYYGKLEARLRGLGIQAPIHITSSNGGTVSVDTARRRPVDTLLSGPASGVVAAARIAEQAKRPQIITLDMGGTSSDIAVTQDGKPEHTTETKIGDLPLILPVVNVRAIGAGGGSIVWVDPQGVLKVGPESAGAEPGPACYGRGGAEPTITDCYVVAGYLDPDHFLGGRMKLDAEAARRALETIAERLGMTGSDRAVLAADAALRVATARMATEVSKGMAQRGLDPAEFTLMPYGGAGPTHAALLSNEVGIRSMLVPLSPGTFCAMGAIMSDLRRDFARSRRLTLGLDPAAADELRAVLTGLEREALDWIAGEGDVIEAPRIEASADMQYPRTAFELNTAIPDDQWREGTAEQIAELFHRQHERLYGFRDDGSPVDVTTIRLAQPAAFRGWSFRSLRRGPPPNRSASAGSSTTGTGAPPRSTGGLTCGPARRSRGRRSSSRKIRRFGYCRAGRPRRMILAPCE